MKPKTLLIAAAMALASCRTEAAIISWGTASSFAVLAGTTVTSTCATVLDGDLSSVQLTGNLVLDGNGDYVFLIGSTLTTAAGSTIQTINGASWANIYFQVGSSATLGAGTLFLGNIVANTSVTLGTGTNVDGHVFGIDGAVSLDANAIVVPEPSYGSLLAAGLVMLIPRRRRTRRSHGFA